MSDKQEIIGVVESKIPQTSENPKAPAGHIKVDGKRIAVWEKEAFDALEEKESYAFDCSVKPNEYQGKTYQNYSMVSATIAIKPVKSDLKVGPYEVFINDNIKEINMPKIAIDYLKEKLA